MEETKTPNTDGFVDYVIRRVQSKTDTAFRAVMKRAGNPAFESAAWEYLVPFCDISQDYQRLAFVAVGAAIANEAPEKDGDASVGKVLRSICGDDKDAIEREGKRLRRLIACDNYAELLPVLKPMLVYLQDKGTAKLSYKRLLKDIIYWNKRTQIAWTEDFYMRHSMSKEKTEA